MQGRFITVEGGEGAGKSTMMAHIMNWLEQHGQRVVRTREPGGTGLAETLREILLDKKNDSLSDLAELLLIFASRAQHLEEVIRPALARGETVLCDRFTDATWAYQGGGRRISADDIAALEKLVHGDLQPDLTLLLDLPVEQGMSRALNRSESDRFESESRGFFQRVRDAYLQRARSEPDRFVIIDASRPMRQVREQIEHVLKERLQT
jgi:dTMP kinase